MHRFLDVGQQYAPVLLAATWRGALVLLIALACSVALRNRPAAARHMVWTVAVAAQLALPLLSYWGPQWQVPIPRAVAGLLPAGSRDLLPVERSGTTSQSVAPDAIPGTTRGVPGVTRAPQSVAPAPPPAPSAAGIEAPVSSSEAPAISGFELLAWTWLAGAFFVLTRFVIGTVAVAGFARRGSRVADGDWLSLMQQLSTSLDIRRPLTLMRGNGLGVPLTWGILYPIVMLPDDADSWPAERRRFVLVHEMAHIKRLDALTQLVGQFALMLFWFNPLVWIANRRMQLEREHACDDYVLRHGTSPSHYAEELLSMVRALGTPSHRNAQPAFAALAMARRSEFEGRMLSILDPHLARHAIGKGRALMGTIVALAIVFPLAALQPYQPAPTQRNLTNTPSALTSSAPTPVNTMVSTTGSTNPLTSGTTLAPRLGASDRALGSSLAVKNNPVPATATTDSAASERAVVYACDDRQWNRSRSTNTHIHSDDDGDSSPSFSYLQTSPARCTSVVVRGRVTWAENEEDVARMAPGAVATFRDRVPSMDRELNISSGSGASLARQYRVNGEERAYDEEAQRWFASFLPVVLAEAAVNVEPRVARWRSQGGVSGALSHVANLRSSGAKRAHYEALLKDRTLSGSDIDNVVRQAGEELQASSGDLRAVLSQAAPSRRGSGAVVHTSDAIERAVAGITSSGDRTEVLLLYGTTADRDMLRMVARVAAGIESSGDKARLLMALAARYHEGSDPALYESFYATVRTIASSGDMRNVLIAAIPLAARARSSTLALLAASRDIASSGDRAAVMISLAESGAVRENDTREAFFDAADGIASDGDRSRVLRAIARR